jgi:hypothetical protein
MSEIVRLPSARVTHSYVALITPCAALLLALGACDQPAPVKPAPTKPSAAPPAVATPAPAKTPGAPGEAEVEALIDRWLAAQNGGDFAAYEALYADKMSGIKRAGSRTYRMDRRSWMADRKRMFAQPQKVSAESVKVSPLPAGASVSFVQTYGSAGFQDRGEKHLLLVAGKGGLRIVSEEMLASSVGADRNGTPEKGFYFVVHADRPYVVLEQRVDPSWSVDKPQRMHVKVVAPNHPRELPTYVTRLDVSAALPADRKALVGRRLQVVTAQGASCETSVGELTTLAALVPSELEQQWLGTYHEEGEPPQPRWTDEAIDESIAGMAAGAGGLMLAAPLDKCDGEFAVDAGRSVKVLGALKQLQPGAGMALLDLAHASKAYAKLNAETKAAEGSGREHWYQWEELRSPPPPSPYRVLRAAALDAYSGGPHGVLFAVFEQNRQGETKLKGMTPELVNAGYANDRLIPELLIDLDEDGAPEVLTRTSDILGRTLISFGKGSASVQELGYADLGCYD